jgi:hypothetical protein
MVSQLCRTVIKQRNNNSTPSEQFHNTIAKLSETVVKSTPPTSIYMTAHSGYLLGTGATIKSDGIKLVL